MDNKCTLLMSGFALALSLAALIISVNTNESIIDCAEPVVQLRWYEDVNLDDYDPETTDVYLQARELYGVAGQCQYGPWSRVQYTNDLYENGTLKD